MRTIVLGMILFLGGIFTVAAQSVYVTKTGTKYHKETCFHLKESKRELDLKKAKTLNYSGCKHCKPIGFQSKESTRLTSLQHKATSSSKRSVAVQCSGKTKAGSRCKRKTKNSSGHCYQH